MRKLLYIDDEEHNLRTLEVALRKWFKVYTLSRPLQTIGIIEEENINVVITDQRMPEITGLDLAAKINMLFPHAVVIILTAYDDNETMQQAINQGGIFRYLLKPWDLKDIKQTLESAFETYELREKNINLVNNLLAQNHLLMQQEEKYRLIFENSPYGIAHFTREGNITQINSKFTEITGIDSPWIENNTIQDINDVHLTEAINKLFEEIDESSSNWVYQSLDDSKTTPVKAQLAPVKKGITIIGGIIFLEDLTEKIRQEELKKQIAVVKESARFKQNFLANMSHEIRTPLAGVMGMTDILAQTRLDAEQKGFLEILQQAGYDLHAIINQVLDFSKIEAGKVSLNLTAFPFQSLISKAEKLFASICQKPINLEIDHEKEIPKYIIADEIRLMQIINNLISNAVKFTNEGMITLGAQLISHNEASNKVTIKFSVTDTGKGIPYEQQGLLFTPFTQIDDQDTRKFEGTGLGLSICKELAKLHGGNTGLISHPGKGSTFWFTFEAKTASAEQITELQKSPRREEFPKNLRILLAEDKPINQKVFSLLLSSLGCKVTIANNGEEVLKIFKEEEFDLVLMDIQMPLLNGITATQKLKAKYTNLPPIVGLSANAFEGDREKYMHLGMDEYITKPLKIEELHRVVSLFNM